MKKKILAFTIIVMFASLAAFATFDGLTSVGVNYEFRDGVHLGGLTTQNFGYINDCPVGYLVSVNSDFNLGEDSMSIEMLLGPSYRYLLSNVPMSIDTAAGVSLAYQDFNSNLFELGVGGYLGATYYWTDLVALLVGCNIGYDMWQLDLTTAENGFPGIFHVSPVLSVGFRY